MCFRFQIDDQIILLLNAWCELLLFSCCFRSMSTPGEIRVSLGKSITLAQAKELGLGPCIERMLNLTEHLRRLRVDKFEYVAMKVIILLTSGEIANRNLMHRIVGVAVISAKKYKRQRRKRQSVTAKREKSQTPKVLTAILTLPNLT